MLDWYKRRSDAALAAQKLAPKVKKRNVITSRPTITKSDFFDAEGFPALCPFKVLNVPPKALNAEINAAFQEAVQKLDLTSVKFLRIKSAYEFLTNVYYIEKRRLYFIGRCEKCEKMDRMEAEIAELKARLLAIEGGCATHETGDEPGKIVNDKKVSPDAYS